MFFTDPWVTAFEVKFWKNPRSIFVVLKHVHVHCLRAISCCHSLNVSLNCVKSKRNIIMAAQRFSIYFSKTRQWKRKNIILGCKPRVVSGDNYSDSLFWWQSSNQAPWWNVSYNVGKWMELYQLYHHYDWWMC